MTFQQLFGLAAGFFALAGFVPYILAILRRRTVPSRSTWLIWTVVGSMLCASSWGGGARATIWLAVGYVVGPLAVFCLSLRFGTGGWSVLDRICLLSSGGSALLWAVTGQPLLALLLNLAVDAMGAVPTLAKVWRDPGSEDILAWGTFLVAATLNIVAAWPWQLNTLLYPGYLFALSASVMVLSLRRTPLPE